MDNQAAVRLFEGQAATTNSARRHAYRQHIPEPLPAPRICRTRVYRWRPALADLVRRSMRLS